MTEHHASCSCGQLPRAVRGEPIRDGSFRAIPEGAFADPAFPVSSVSGYEQRRHARASVPDGAEHFE